MKKRLMGCLTALFLIAAPYMAQAATADYEKSAKAHPFYQAIIDVSKTMSGKKLLEYLNARMQEDATRVPVVSLWLRDNSINEDDGRRLQSLYFLSYAETLTAMADGERESGNPGAYRELLETAMLNFHIFELMATVDAARCQDQTAGDAIQSMMNQRYDIFRTAYRTFPRPIFDTIEKTALQHEEKFLGRSPNADICQMGKSYLIDLSKAPGVEKKTVDDPLQPGRKKMILVPPPGYVYAPGFVSDKQWLAARKNALKEVTQEWAKRYKGAIQ